MITGDCGLEKPLQYTLDPSLRDPHEAPMAQVNALIAGLPTRDSSLQISSYPKQEDVAVPGLLSDRKEGTEFDLSASYLQTASLTATVSLNPKVHQSVRIHVSIARGIAPILAAARNGSGMYEPAD